MHFLIFLCFFLKLTLTLKSLTSQGNLNVCQHYASPNNIHILLITNDQETVQNYRYQVVAVKLFFATQFEILWLHRMYFN